MTRGFAMMGGVLLLVAACSTSDATPEELAESMLESCSQGDSDAVRDLLAPDASFVFQDEPAEAVWEASRYPVQEYGFAEAEDFDNDGEATLADIIQAQCALFGGLLDRIETSCEAAGAAVVTCSEIQFTRFGGAGYPYAYEFTFEDGQLAVQHQLPVDDEALEAGFKDWEGGMTAYRSWVKATHPGSYDSMFLNYQPIMLPDSLELHHEMMDEYFAATGA